MRIIRGNAIDFVPAAHEDPHKPGVLKRVLATQADLQAGQVQMLNWAWLKPGHAFELHYHEDMQEVFCIVSGSVEMEVIPAELNSRKQNGDANAQKVDGQNVLLHQGDAIIIDPLEAHRMWNSFQAEAYYVVFGIAAGKDGKTVVVSA